MVEGWRVPGFAELKELGEGGQGRAVLVRDEASGRIAVLKYVSAAASPTARERFRRESALLKQVSSPYVAGWFGHFEHSSGSAILMEAVDGVSLRKVLDEHGALEPWTALTVLKGSLLGLASAHAVEVVHRDYKPGNVVVRGDGCSKLIDFGIAGLWGEEGSRSGTPAYMSPEQWRGEPASPATDVYAATCVFFECVTGHRPDRAVPLSAEEAPEPVRRLVLRGMADSAADRPQTASVFVDELETCATQAYGPAWENRGVEALAAASAALAAVFPLAASMSAGAQAQIAASTTARTVLTKAATGKVAAAIAGAAVVTAGVAVVVTKPAPHHPRPVVAALALAEVPAPAAATTGLVHLKGQYPRLSGGGVSLTVVNAALRSAIVDSEQQWAKGYPLPCTQYCNEAHLTITPRVLAFNAHLVSVLTLFSGNYPGGVNSEWYVSTTIQVPSGHVVILDELFADRAAALAAISAATTAQLGRNSCVAQSWTGVGADIWKAGVAPTADNYKNYAISPQGLTVGIQQGQAAAEACGPFTATIGWAALQSYLSPLGGHLERAAPPGS